MAEDLPTFRHQVVLLTRDFCPRPGALSGAVLLFISYVWISKIHFRISIIHFGYPKMNEGYHKIIMDIQKYIFGYPKVKLNFGYP